MLPDPRSPLLSREETRLLAEQLAVITRAGRPLASGLIAAAEETPSRRLATAMNLIAERLQQGRPLDDVLRENPYLIPPHMLRLIETGIRAGNLPAVLSEQVEIDRASFDVQRSIRLAIGYPIFIALICVLLLVLLTIFIVPDMQKVAKDFNVALPFSTKALFAISGRSAAIVAGAFLAATTMALIALRVSLPPQRWRFALTHIPIFGPMLLWRGLAEWSRLVSLLLKQGLPAPEALHLASTGVNDALMAVEGLRLARATSQGRGIADSLAEIGTLPSPIVPIVRWGEQSGTLADAFSTVAEMYENRIRLRSGLARAILPPITFILVAITVLWLVNALFGPLVELITSLSGGARRKKGGLGPAAIAVDASAIATAVLGMIAGATVMAYVIRSIFAVANGPSSKSRITRELSQILRVCIWCLLFAALGFALVALAPFIVATLAWFAGLFVFLTVIRQCRQADRRALVWLLGTAVDKGIPISAAACAFADENNTVLGAKAMRLAALLDHGHSLDQSIYSADISLPTDTLVALRTAYVTRSATPLIQSAGHYAGTDAMIHSAAAKIVYAMVFLLVALGIITFIMIKIVPAYIKIFRDFDTALPATTIALIELSNSMYEVGGIAILLMFLLVVATGYAVFRLLGVGSWDPPLVRQITKPLDCSIVLRSLAGAVDRNTPIASMVAALAQKYPKSHIRSRLYAAASRIAKGADWCDSLRRSGLLSKAEAGLLTAAERVGNLNWALNSMAERLSRQFINRANQILQIGFPLVLLLFAAGVFFVACALIEPLAELILAITPGTKRR
jgi:type II secretory pathway component PulF